MDRQICAPLVYLEKVTKSYGGRTVLELPELMLQPGGCYALLGANGSGKSTLLRLLAGIIAPDSGAVTWGEPARTVGYLPQKPYAFSCSVLQNVLLATEKGPRAQRREQACRALEQVGLLHLAEKRGDRLSGGETQRMALARLLVRPWDVLLLDEPTAAADIAAARQMEQAIVRYAGETGCLLVFATHTVAQAERLAGEVIFLHEGRMAEQGPAKQLLHHPESEVLQAFLSFWSTE